MTKQTRVRDFGRSAMALAVCASFASVQAQEKKEEAPNPVEANISVETGAAWVSGNASDRAFWGQYNGMRNQDAYGILNFDYSRRNSESGTWLDIIGTNLGLQTREIGLKWVRQGNWSVEASYGELWAVNPYTVNTGVAGHGTTTPTAVYLTGGPGTGYDAELSTKRKGLLLGGSKWLGSEFQLEGNVYSENKTGTQLFGIGGVCTSRNPLECNVVPGMTAGSAVLYYPQPIDYNHTQVEARLNYAGSSLQLSGGYYGSFLSNGNGALTAGVPTTFNNAVGQPLPTGFLDGSGNPATIAPVVSLSPENQFNYLDVTGAWTIIPSVRTNFKVAYSQAKQNQDFAGAGITGVPAGYNLGGEVNTTLAQVRVVATPIEKLTLVAEYRYENMEDDTPVVAYNLVATTVSTNQTVSRETNSGKLEATYRFPWAVQGTAGVGFNSIDLGNYTPTASYGGVSALRQKTDETSWWLQVRRSLTESISGSLSYIGSSRNGSDWLAPASNGVGLVTVTDPATQLGPNAIYMPTMADRDRNKFRLLLNWMATEALSLQFAADLGKDSYNAPTQYALQESKFDLYTLDVNYALSDAWNLNGYLSAGKQKLNQARPAGYILAFDDSSLAAGVGFNGKTGERMTLGGLLSYVSNEDKYAQSLGPNAAAGSAQLLAVTGGLPDIVYRRLELRLFGTYAFTDRSTIRADAAYQRLTYDDWGYSYNGTPFLYSDNSTVYLQPDQNVGYIGISYIYSFR